MLPSSGHVSIRSSCFFCFFSPSVSFSIAVLFFLFRYSYHVPLIFLRRGLARAAAQPAPSTTGPRVDGFDFPFYSFSVGLFSVLGFRQDDRRVCISKNEKTLFRFEQIRKKGSPSFFWFTTTCAFNIIIRAQMDCREGLRNTRRKQSATAKREKTETMAVVVVVLSKKRNNFDSLVFSPKRDGQGRLDRWRFVYVASTLLLFCFFTFFLFGNVIPLVSRHCFFYANGGQFSFFFSQM